MRSQDEYKENKMRGFPKTIGTKKDLENLLAIPEFVDQAKTKLKEFEEARMVWTVTKALKEGKAGQEDKGYKVIIQETLNGEIERLQMELKDDPEAIFNRLELVKLKNELSGR